jgi:alkylated DNA repair dioxygenase AlkB
MVVDFVCEKFVETKRGDLMKFGTFNSVFLNLYRDNNDSVAWHGDRESELGNRPEQTYS